MLATRLLPFLAVSLFLAGGAAAAETLPERGAALLQENCSRCHAVAPGETSPLPEAPTFAEVAKRYPAEDLEEALAEGIVTGHPDMPEFVFEPDEIDAIVAYFDSLAGK